MKRLTRRDSLFIFQVFFILYFNKTINPLNFAELRGFILVLLSFFTFQAERKGFEPLVPVRVQRFSRPPRSTTPASFLVKPMLKIDFIMKSYLTFVRTYKGAMSPSIGFLSASS